MPQTGGRIGGYCHPQWIAIAEARAKLRPYARALSQVSSLTKLTYDELDWAFMQIRHSSPHKSNAVKSDRH